MLKTPRVGTVVLDGLLEGPLPPCENSEEILHEWIAFARANDLCFHCQLEYGRFSLLADNKPLSISGKPDIQNTIVQAIDRLLSLYPETMRGQVFSTLRSTEYQAETEIQSIYIVAPTGVQVREKTLVRERRKEKSTLLHDYRKFFLLSFPLITFLIISLFVVDYIALYHRLAPQFWGVDANTIVISAEKVAPYLTVEKTGFDRVHRALICQVRRLPGYPATVADFALQERQIEQQGNLHNLAALHALVLNGTLHARFLDSQDNVLTETSYRIRDLMDREDISITLPLMSFPETVKIQFDF